MGTTDILARSICNQYREGRMDFSRAFHKLVEIECDVEYYGLLENIRDKKQRDNDGAI